MKKDKKWVMYGRQALGVCSYQWVRIASGKGEYQMERAKAWYKNSYQGIKFEES